MKNYIMIQLILGNISCFVKKSCVSDAFSQKIFLNTNQYCLKDIQIHINHLQELA